VAQNFQRSLVQPAAGLMPAEDQVGHGFGRGRSTSKDGDHPRAGQPQCGPPAGRGGDVGVPALPATFLSTTQDVIYCVCAEGALAERTLAFATARAPPQQDACSVPQLLSWGCSL